MDIEDVVFGTPLVRVNGPGMDRAVPLSPSPPSLLSIASFRGCNLSRILRKIGGGGGGGGEEARKERANPSAEESFAASV